MEDLDRRIGARIAAIREDQDFSQAEFSAELRAGGLNWSQGTLSKVESGQRSVRLAEAKVLSEILDLPLNLMFREPDYLADRSRAVRTEFEAAEARFRKAREGLAIAGARLEAVRLLEAIRAGNPGPFRVHNCSPLALLRFVTGETHIARPSEVRALLRSLDLRGLADDLYGNAEADVQAWLNDPAAVPTQFSEEFNRDPEGSTTKQWLDLHERAIKGDQGRLLLLVEKEYLDRLHYALGPTMASLGIEFVPPFGETIPAKIEGLGTDG